MGRVAVLIVEVSPLNEVLGSASSRLTDEDGQHMMTGLLTMLERCSVGEFWIDVQLPLMAALILKGSDARKSLRVRVFQASSSSFNLIITYLLKLGAARLLFHPIAPYHKMNSAQSQMRRGWLPLPLRRRFPSCIVQL